MHSAAYCCYKFLFNVYKHLIDVTFLTLFSLFLDIIYIAVLIILTLTLTGIISKLYYVYVVAAWGAVGGATSMGENVPIFVTQ